MPLALADVPQILSILNDKDGQLLTKDQKVAVDALSKEKRIFAGEAAVQSGIVTPEELQSKLLKQADMKAAAAVKDIATIAEKGTQDKPPFLKANWGNNGVNKPAESPTLIDGAQSAVNFAQNMVMIANDHPKLAKELQPAVHAAATLAQTLADPEKAEALTDKERKQLTDVAAKGLRAAVEKSGVKLMAGKEEVALEDFVKARTQEIELAHKAEKTHAKALREQLAKDIGLDANGRNGISGDEMSRFANRVKTDLYNAKHGKPEQQEAAKARLGKLDMDGDGDIDKKDVEAIKKLGGGAYDKLHLDKITKALGGQSFQITDTQGPESAPATNLGKKNPAAGHSKF